MQEELQAIGVNQTLELVPKTLDMSIIGTKWAYKVKYNANNSVDKLKARLIAKYFNQHEGIDFVESLSPIVKPVIVRMVLALATIKKWHIHQLDVRNSFLNGVLQETLFVSQPPRF